MAPWIDVAGWTLLHFVWQGAVIGAGAAIGFWLLRDATSDVRYTMASAALILMLLSPIVTAGLLSSPSASMMSASSTTSPVFTPTRHAGRAAERRQQANLRSVPWTRDPGSFKYCRQSWRCGSSAWR